jgi:hypothetical protein
MAALQTGWREFARPFSVPGPVPRHDPALGTHRVDMYRGPINRTIACHRGSEFPNALAILTTRTLQFFLPDEMNFSLLCHSLARLRAVLSDWETFAIPRCGLSGFCTQRDFESTGQVKNDFYQQHSVRHFAGNRVRHKLSAVSILWRETT